MSDDDNNPRHRALQAARILNDLHGAEIFSALKTAEELTKLVAASLPIDIVGQNHFDAQYNLEAKRKPARLLCSITVTDPMVQVGDLVEVYVKHEKRKTKVAYFPYDPLDRSPFRCRHCLSLKQTINGCGL